MRNFLIICAAVLMLLATSTEAANPVRIARLPIIFLSSTPDRDTCAVLEMKIARAVNIPMNKTLKVAEYIPTNISTAALNNIWHKIHADNKRAKLSDAMRPLARQINADIIVCPVLLQYSQRIMNAASWGETIMDSNVRVELIVYDRRTDNLIDKKAAQMYHDSYHPLGTASTLAKICFDNVIEETNLRRLIRAIR